MEVVELEEEFNPVVQLALSPVKLGPGGSGGVPVGYLETKWPPLITEGREPTDVTK